MEGPGRWRQTRYGYVRRVRANRAGEAGADGLNGGPLMTGWRGRWKRPSTPETGATVDWGAISTALHEIESVLSEDRDPAAATIAHIQADVAAGRYVSVLARLTSGEMWNHMGSFFDRSLDDKVLDRRFRVAQVQLADALEAGGVAGTDVSQWAALLRSWDSK
jgi:hypothetical protein